MSMPKPLPLTRETIKNRIKDEMSGINPGVDFGSPSHKKDAPPLPDIMDLGLPLSVRREIEGMAGDHLELGKMERTAKKDRERLTLRIKELITEHVAIDETPSFVCSVARMSIYTQDRTSFDKDVLRDALLNLGVKPAIIVKAMQAATTTKPVMTLRVSPLDGEEE